MLVEVGAEDPEKGPFHRLLAVTKGREKRERQREKEFCKRIGKNCITTNCSCWPREVPSFIEEFLENAKLWKRPGDRFEACVGKSGCRVDFGPTAKRQKREREEGRERVGWNCSYCGLLSHNGEVISNLLWCVQEAADISGFPYFLLYFEIILSCDKHEWNCSQFLQPIYCDNLNLKNKINHNTLV